MTVIEHVKQQSIAKDDDLEFHFPQGIAGFPNASKFGFIYEGQGHMVCMQSIDQPEASFILTPWDRERLGDAPQLTNEQRTCLKISEHDEVLWMIVLNPFADKEWVTANLRAPIAISQKNRTGVQCILSYPDIELRYKWMKQPNP